MKFPTNSSGIGTTGAVGCILLISVITGHISSLWLMVSTPLILSAIGQESGR